MKVFSIFLLCTLLHLQYAFHVEIPNHKGNRLISKVRLSLLDPFTIGVATAAVASGFAAGTVIQAPKLEELESVKIVLSKELEAFKSNTTTWEDEAFQQREQLEDALFEMDRSFEEQTVEDKKAFDSSLQVQMKELAITLMDDFDQEKKAIKSELTTRFEVEIEQMKQKNLLDKLNSITEISERNKSQSSNILDNLSNMSKENESLKDQLSESEKTISQLSSKKGFFR